MRLIIELPIYMRCWKWVSVMFETFGSCCQLLVARGSKLPRALCHVATTLRRVLAHLVTSSSLPSPDGETALAELSLVDIQCRTQVAIVDLDILSLLYDLRGHAKAWPDRRLVRNHRSSVKWSIRYALESYIIPVSKGVATIPQTPQMRYV